MDCFSCQTIAKYLLLCYLCNVIREKNINLENQF